MRCSFLKHKSDGVLGEPDIESGEWFGDFNDNDDRSDAFRANLHVEQIPGTSMIVIRFDTSSSADARTIANMVMRRYESVAKADQRYRNRDTVDNLNYRIARLRADEDDLKLEMERIRDEAKRAEQELDLAMLRESRNDLLREVEEERFSHRNARSPVTIVKVARRSD